MNSRTIRNDQTAVSVCPEVGSSICSMRFLLNGKWVDIMRPTPQGAMEAKDPGAFSSFHLMPYSNRIENGILHFRGKTLSLFRNDADGHAIHGVVRDMPWKVRSEDGQQLEVGLDSREQENVNWPWPFSCRMMFRLSGNVFTIRFCIRNEGSEVMPVGFGTHPYFSRKLTGQDDRVLVKLPVKGLYPGNTPIPTGKWIPVPRELDFSEERILREDRLVDNCFRAGEGSVMVQWPGSGVAMTMEADPVFENLILYAPPGKPFFAIEPVTNCNNGFNMAESGVDDTGTICLRPGEEAAGNIRITIRENR